MSSILIVGGSVAGFTVAAQLRVRGMTDPVTIVDPAGAVYDRPPLSKEYLLGEIDDEGIALAAPGWFTEHSVALVAGTVTRLDLAEPGATHVAVLDDGAELAATTVVLATGGEPRALAGIAPGAEVFTLRRREDAHVLRDAITDPKRSRPAHVAIIGAGLLGAELASAARTLGADVTVFSASVAPGAPALGFSLASRLHAMHAEHGVTVVYESVVSVAPSAAEDGKMSITGVAGTQLTADVVIAAIGILPNTELAEAAGLDVDDGVLVDEAGRSSHPDVFAVGDVARSRFAIQRVEHWQHAINTATMAAAAISGEAPGELALEWFWSDRYGAHVEAVGSLKPAAAEALAVGYTVIHRDLGDQHSVFVLDCTGLLVGAATLNDAMSVRAARRIIRRGIIPDPEALADPNIPVKKLAR